MYHVSIDMRGVFCIELVHHEPCPMLVMLLMFVFMESSLERYECCRTAKITMLGFILIFHFDRVYSNMLIVSTINVRCAQR